MRDVRAYLWDMREATAAIQRFTAGLDEQAYAENEVVRAAVERKFEIIGEALGRLAKLDPELAARIPNTREIIAFRNFLIHGYAGVEHDRVWQTVQTSLPTLALSVQLLLEQLTEGES